MIFSSKLPRENNEPNRVLTYIRGNNWADMGPETKRTLVSIHLNILRFSQADHNGAGWARYTPDTLEMMEHARKVLERLARLA